MTDRKILSLASDFRKRIDKAQKKDCFLNSIFKDFPIQCCGDASMLLAEFLKANGVETLWISGQEIDTHETHAWLVVKDDRINAPRSRYDEVPNNVMDLLRAYSGNVTKNFSKDGCYDERDVENGLIIDITGDQFGEASVYVGYMDRAHKRFDFVAAYEHEGLFDEELIELYTTILTQG